VQLVVECKAKGANFMDTLLGTMCFVHAQPGHQCWCKFAYALFFVGTETTFVRIDHCGAIHSRGIDVLENPEDFTNVFAALMRLDREAQGYHLAFRPTIRQDGTYMMELEFKGRSYEVVEAICQQVHIVDGGTVFLLVSHKNNNDYEELPGLFVLKKVSASI
jgi:hypothetical protein